MPQQGAQAGTLPLESVQRYSAAVVAGFVGSAASARARLARLVPSIATETLSVRSLPCVALTLPGDWSAASTLAAIAASLDAVVVFQSRPVSADGLDVTMRELAGDVLIAIRLCPPGFVVALDELLAYRPMANMSRQELESLVRQTLGGILALPRDERDRLVESLWAQHQGERFRLDLGLHALRLLSRSPAALTLQRGTAFGTSSSP